MKKKGNKKMLIPRQEVIDNPIPTSLFVSDNYSCLEIAGFLKMKNNMMIMTRKSRKSV